jgi:hypothetical protein
MKSMSYKDYVDHYAELLDYNTTKLKEARDVKGLRDDIGTKRRLQEYLIKELSDIIEAIE